jgi:hypothetical protein
MQRVQVIVLVMSALAVACGRKFRSQVMSTSSASASAIGRAAPTEHVRPPPSFEKAEQLAERVETRRKELERRLVAMQSALVRDDRRAFADALIYPTRLNTSSGCRTVVSNAEQFLTHHDGVMTTELHRTVRRATPPIAFVHGAWAVASDIWFTEEGAPGFVFNTTLWNAAGLPCEGEEPTDPPKGFATVWRVASTCSAKEAPSVTSPAKQLRFDFQKRTTTFSRPGEKAQTCGIDRISESEIDGRLPTSILHCAPERWPERALTLFLDCRKVGQHYVNALSLFGSALVQVGNDNHVVTFSPEG